LRTWLIKSEPDVFSIDDLAAKGRSGWDGVRNYQARNYMRDDMKPGDLCLFWHSNATPPGAVGLARVDGAPRPDPTQFDPESEYYDPKSTAAEPRWVMVDVAFHEKFPNPVTLESLKARADAFEGLLVIKRGMRLSIQPVEQAHFDAIVAAGRGQAP
jgi:predicted RNA-binding protein with PUA-like domain